MEGPPSNAILMPPPCPISWKGNTTFNSSWLHPKTCEYSFLVYKWCIHALNNQMEWFTQWNYKRLHVRQLSCFASQLLDGHSGFLWYQTSNIVCSVMFKHLKKKIFFFCEITYKSDEKLTSLLHLTWYKIIINWYYHFTFLYTILHYIGLWWT